MPILLITLIILIAKWIWNPDNNANKLQVSIDDIRKQLNRIEEKMNKIDKG